MKRDALETISRRALLGAASAGAASLLWLPRARAGQPLIELVDRPQQLASPLSVFDRDITPTDAFFVRSHFGPPSLDMNRPLVVDGLVEKPLRITVADLKKMKPVTLTAVLQCAGNGRAFFKPTMPGVPWQHGAMGQATWTGVRLKDLLALAGVKQGAAHIHLVGADAPPKPTAPAFIRSVPLDKALHEDTLVGFRMNGRPLTLEHGAPMRIVVPGWVGDHWIKWLTRITVAEHEHDGFYVQKGYRIPKEPVAPGTKVPPEQMEPVTVMPVKSIIARPAEGGTSAKGVQEIVGVAFSGSSAVKGVEVSVDNGATWLPARMDGKTGPGRWGVFRASVKLGPGTYTVMSRATDAGGAVQPPEPSWNPSGYNYNAWHRVTWTVA